MEKQGNRKFIAHFLNKEHKCYFNSFQHGLQCNYWAATTLQIECFLSGTSKLLQSTCKLFKIFKRLIVRSTSATTFHSSLSLHVHYNKSMSYFPARVEYWVFIYIDDTYFVCISILPSITSMLMGLIPRV